MRKISTLLVAAGLLASAGTASAQLRIPIQEDKPVEMYALGAGKSAMSSTPGVFKLNLTNLSTPTQLNPEFISYSGSPLGGGGTFLSPEKVIGIKWAYNPYAFEASAENSWAQTFYGQATPNVPAEVYDMTYDEQNDIVYCWYKTSTSIMAQYALATYNPTTKTATRVGSAPTKKIYAIAIDKDGQLWGVGDSGAFYSIDKSTGVATQVTTWSIKPQTTVPMSAAVDPASNMLYLVAQDASSDNVSSLYKVDLSTYAIEKVATLSKFYNCLYIAGSTISNGAPAQVEDLAASFNGEATVVSFTAPTLNAGGKALTGDLTYSITVDGEEAATGSVQPGLKVSVNINPADGQHEIAVTVSNSEGSSKAVKTSVVSGYDQPTAVTDLKAVADGNNVTLTWTAPTGKNGGTVDMSKVSYTISCNGTDVATGVTATTYTDALEGYYAQYTYSVTVVYNDAAAESASTSVMAGNAYPVPVSVNLADIPSLAAAGFTVLDANNDNSGKWTLEKSGDTAYLECYSTIYFSRNDYIYMPKVSLKAGVPYQISYKALLTRTSGWADRTADISVLIAKEPTSVADDYKVLKNYVLPVNKDEVWNDYTVDFTVDADGDYFLGLLDYQSATNYAVHYLRVKDLSIVANIPTPAAVTDLAATPEADNNRNIVLTFTLPTKDTKGETLTSITAVEIYRGTELLETIEGTLTPGEAMTYTDENAPRGFKSYSVVVLNGDNASAKATVSVMVGYLNNLAVELVAAPEGMVKPNGGGAITVKVTNDGFEQVLEEAYAVVLYCDGAKVDALPGKALAEDESTEYTFTLNWTGTAPKSAEYVVKVEFNGDENLTDNETAPITVNFQTSTGVDDAVCAALEVAAADGVITVKGAEGMHVMVFVADGRTIVSTTATALYTTPALPRGAYMVCVGATTVKVVL